MPRSSDTPVRPPSLLRLGAVTRLTRSGGPGVLPEVLNPIEKYM